MKNNDFIAACIVPTGVGASIGGFAGDASPYINLLSKVCPIITNPNSVNAAVFSGINDNILYTEGFSLNSFFKGEIALRPSKFNKIGVIFDKEIPKEVLNIHINTINAVKSTYGINYAGYEITQESVGVSFEVSDSNISTGSVKNPDTLLQSARKLIEKGTEAIAVVCFFDTPEDDENYACGEGIDPVGGVEAIISHIISREFKIPAAHAPAFDENSLTISHEIVDKKASAEYITPTFLPCIMLGLYNAPKIIDIKHKTPTDIELKDINALIMPHNSLGGIPVLKALERNIPVIAITENDTSLNITPKQMNIEDKVILARSYKEAAGILLGLKNGIYF